MKRPHRCFAWVLVSFCVLGAGSGSGKEEPVPRSDSGFPQGPIEPDHVRTVLTGATYRWEMKHIPQTVQVADENIVRFEGIKSGRGLWFTGLNPGTTRFRVADREGDSETFEVVVRSNQLTLTVGTTIPLRMTTKKPIKKVVNENEQVIYVQPMVGDPTTVLIKGLAPGRARLTLTDVDGKTEARDLGPPRPSKP